MVNTRDYNKKRFSIYDSEEKTALELMNELGDVCNNVLDRAEQVENLANDNKNNKVSYNDLHTKYQLTIAGDTANFNGTWQGLKKPTLSDEGMRATVEHILEKDIPSINKRFIKQSRVNVSNRVYSSCVATFIVDDGTSNFLSLVKPVFDSNGIKGSIGIITEKVGTSGYMSLLELKALQKDGYSMLCHSATHLDTIYKPGVATATDRIITNDYEKAYNFMIENSFNGADTIVYPWGGFENSGRYKNLARDFFNNGINSSGGYNLELNDNMYLNRTFINKNKSLDEYKTLINECINNQGWLIFGIHANTNEIDPTHLNSIIAYLNEKGVKILPFIEANEIKGNAINIGEYTMAEKFFVSRSGKVLMNNPVITTSYDTVNGENYSVILKNIKKLEKTVVANIKLENSSQTGTFTNSQVLCTISNLRVPTQIITNCVITDSGVVHSGGVVIENTGATDLAIKCHGNMPELTHIKWININFSFII